MDQVFAELADTVYAGLIDPRELWDLSKLDAADVHVNTARPRKPKPPPKQAHSNTARALVLGGVAEGLGTFRAGQVAHHAVSTPEVRSAVGRMGKLRAITPTGGRNIGEFALQATNLGVGLTAAHALSQHAKATQKTQQLQQRKRLAKGLLPKLPFKSLRPVVVRMTDEQAAHHALKVAHATTSAQRIVAGSAAVAGAVVGNEVGRRRRRVAKSLRPVATAAAAPGASPPLAAGVRASNTGGVGRGLGRRGRQLGVAITPAPKPLPLVKWAGQIAKVDLEKRQVFGWCSVVELDGKPVVDRQGDYIPLDEVEKSAYTYVIESRIGGDMHSRVAKATAPRHTADLIESFVVTPEKLAKMGLTSPSRTYGWWTGFSVNDDEQWNMVKSGERTAFSLHGTGSRTDMVMA